MEPSVLVWNSLTAIVAVAIGCCLASFARPVLLGLVVVFTLFANVQFWGGPYRDPAETKRFVKLMFELPLGLGCMMTFALLSKDRQDKALAWFTRYVNVAVTVNIIMMVFTPDGGTYRGFSSRFVCVALVVWLLQEMAKPRFQTTHFDAGFFIFRSSPLNWVLCHAFYRMALLSLPAFESSRYLLLEPLSLSTMFVLYHLHQKRHPVHYYFGFADTLVVSTLALISRYPTTPPLALADLRLPSLSGDQLDMIFVPIQIVVMGSALRAIRHNALAKST